MHSFGYRHNLDVIRDCKEPLERNHSMNRRTSAFLCLLLSAVLLITLPTLLEGIQSQDGQRMAERLRPEKARTLTLWVMRDNTAGEKYLGQQIALFEQQHSGVRVFLRKTDLTDLTAEGAVLPDMLLFSPGAFGNPAEVLIPLMNVPGVCAEGLLSGQSGGTQYATPLWLAPSVLTLPVEWLPEEISITTAPTASSFFDLATPAPTQSQSETQRQLGEADIPWEKLLIPGALALPEGMAQQQLLSMCPTDMRPALVAALAANESTPTSAPTSAGKGQSAPRATQGPGSAKVMTLAAYEAAIGSGQPLCGFAMSPATTQNVLLAGLCRDSDLARMFLEQLLSGDAQAALSGYSLLPVISVENTLPAGTLTAQLLEKYQRGLLLPNSFEYTAQELESLCRDGFLRNADPVETLLRLR